MHDQDVCTLQYVSYTFTKIKIKSKHERLLQDILPFGLHSVTKPLHRLDGHMEGNEDTRKLRERRGRRVKCPVVGRGHPGSQNGLP